MQKLIYNSLNSNLLELFDVIPPFLNIQLVRFFHKRSICSSYKSLLKYLDN